MDQNKIINTPGLQHIIEVIFFNLDFVDFMNCQPINKAINQSQCFDSRNGGSIEVCQKNPLFSQKVHFLRDFFIDPYPKINFV